MTDDITRPQKVKIVTPKYLRLCVFMAMEDGWIIIDHQPEKHLFYVRKQLLLSARLIHCNSVRLSVHLSVCHTGGSVKSGAS